MKVIGYLRVSTEEQARSGLGLGVQREAIAAEAERRGWQVQWIVDDGYSAKNLNRPGITEALALLAGGQARALVVAKLDRVSRSVVDFAGLLARAGAERWGFVALDFGMDTSTPNGELIANVLMSVAQWERRIIGLRTKEALAVAKANGTRLGRPSTLDSGTAAYVADLRAAGLTHRAIAHRLTAEGVPTSRGAAQWHPTQVARALRKANA